MNPKITFTKNPEVSSKATEAELILYDASKEAVHILNRTAYLIWELCDGMHSISDIEKAMRERFSVDREFDLMRDTDQGIEQLLNKGLLIFKPDKDN